MIGLALFSIVSVVLLIGAVVIATSSGVLDSDPVDIEASPLLSQSASTTAAPLPRDGVTITWDASPSSCDGADKRGFTAVLDNGTPGIVEVRMRILDPANQFIHGSHIYAVSPSERLEVHLAGIPAGPSTVQIVDESNEAVIAQTNVRFEDC